MHVDFWNLVGAFGFIFWGAFKIVASGRISKLMFHILGWLGFLNRKHSLIEW